MVAGGRARTKAASRPWSSSGVQCCGGAAAGASRRPAPGWPRAGVQVQLQTGWAGAREVGLLRDVTEPMTPIFRGSLPGAYGLPAAVCVPVSVCPAGSAARAVPRHAPAQCFPRSSPAIKGRLRTARSGRSGSGSSIWVSEGVRRRHFTRALEFRRPRLGTFLAQGASILCGLEPGPRPGPVTGSELAVACAACAVAGCTTFRSPGPAPEPAVRPRYAGRPPRRLVVGPAPTTWCWRRGPPTRHVPSAPPIGRARARVARRLPRHRAPRPTAAPGTPRPRTRPMRAGRPAAGGASVCELGETYGGWQAGSEAAAICRQAYGG